MDSHYAEIKLTGFSESEVLHRRHPDVLYVMPQILSPCNSPTCIPITFCPTLCFLAVERHHDVATVIKESI